MADPWGGWVEEEEVEQGPRRRPERGSASGCGRKLGPRPARGQEPGWWSHWCCCRNGGWGSGAAVGGGGADGARKKEELGEELGCCSGGDSLQTWRLMSSGPVEVAEEEVGEAAQVEEKVEEEREAVDHDAGPYSPG